MEITNKKIPVPPTQGKHIALPRQHNITWMTVLRIFCAAPGKARLASDKSFGENAFRLPALATPEVY